MNIEMLQKQMRSCRKCEELFAERFVDPISMKRPLEVKPIFAGATSAAVMLVGQAPGITEYERVRAFQGPSGDDIRDIFKAVGVMPSSFDEVVYQTSILKCFPGRKTVSRKHRRTGEKIITEEDRTPNAHEIANCLPFLAQQISLLQPQIIVLLGGAAIAGYCRLRSQPFTGGLESYVGRSESWKGMSVIFFPHTSGTSFWLNAKEHRQLFNKAKQLLGQQMRRKDIIA